MKLLTLLLLVGWASTAPTSNDDKLVITEEFFPDELAVYTSQHDILDIYVPLNALNFEDDTDDDDDNDGTTLFFVEGDVNNGKVDSKGLYILKNGKATKLLDKGVGATAAHDDTKDVYFAANDGIYVYNAKENTAEKYGSVTDDIINVTKENGTDVLYILTKDKKLYKVTNEGNKKDQVDDVTNAEQIVLDYSNNLYFYGADKVPYVVNAGGVKQITGLPENPKKVLLLNPPFVIDDGVPFISDNKAYIIYANGTVEESDFDLKVKPSAYSMEATLIQYYGYNKKIYEYNILAIVMGSVLEELKEFLDDQKDTISSIATKRRSNFR